MPYSDEELLEEICRVADITDSEGAPTVTEFDEHSDIDDSTIHRRFGSWNEGVAAAGFEPNAPETAISNDDLIEELHRLRGALGHIPTISEMNEEGEYWGSTYKNHFGSWLASLKEAFDDIENTDEFLARRMADHAPGRPQQHTEDALLEELHRLATEHRDPPRMRDVREHSDRGGKTYIRRFGSWKAALEAAGFEPGHSNHISTDDLLSDLHRLRDELGERPTATDVVEDGQHGIATYQRRFGSWSAALEVAFGEADATDSS